MTSRPMIRVAAAALLVGVVGLVGVGPAAAEPTADIGAVDTADGTVRVLVSLADLADGTAADPDGVQASLNGQPVEASAETASDAGEEVRRISVLAIDISNSMRGDRFDAAQQAALAFIQTAPADVEVSIVGFADAATVLVEPTLDRAELESAVANLTLSPATRLYDGIAEAARVAAVADSGSVLVLSDGKDTSGEPDDALVAELEALDVRVDVVGLQQGEEQLAQLGALAEAGGGSVIDAADPAGLTALFTERAAALADELVVSFPVPADWEGGDGTVSVSVPVDGTAVTDQAFVSVPASSSLAGTDAGTLVPQPAAASAGLTVSKPYMLAGVVGIGLAIIIMVASFANTNTAEKETVADRLKMYTGRHGPGAAAGGPGGAQGVAGVRQQALDLSERALSTGGLEIRIAARLEAAGMKLNSPEWLLMHFGIAVGAPLLAFLLTGGSVIFAVLALVAGILGPWYYLGRRRKRQLKRFGSQLPETLQLISGSLSAGLSFNQALDTVVREGTDPMAAEFRRALVEARLGVNMQDALNGIAERMASDDFAWVVMAVKIQREVGGNLAELLMTVAATLREREYLRRQVQTLSAEGRLSAWILGGMPPVFVGYLALVQPTYLAPMITTTLGWLMVGFASVLMVVGVVWLMKCVKVEI